eukprot:Nitzschia sp. Nitz4//scaffold66_size103028//48589//49086//NITZ4_004499-RA/size103028-snap-gene-0.97-mRNA-1//1//CDS//3329556353//4681//frame0
MRRSQSDSEISMSEKSVSFSTVEFREHAMVLGGSHVPYDGPPLSIDWEVLDSAIVDVEYYECLRAPRRPLEQLIIPGYIREQVLLDSGYTKQEIKKHLQKMKDDERSGVAKFAKKLPGRLFGKAKRAFSVRTP